MPGLARDHVGAATLLRLGPRPDLRNRFAEDPLLDLLALAVQLLQPRREPRRFLAIVGEQQLERRRRMAEPSGRVDPRREPEPDRAGVDDRGIDVRRAHQRLQTGLLRSRERAQAGARKRAVLVEERHDVGDRGERDEVEVLVDVCPKRAEQLVGDAGAAELREGIARRARRDDRAVRKRLAGTVVVGHDHVEAERLRARDLLDRGDPAVDGQDERAALLGEPLDRLTGEPVALVETAREMPVDVRPELAERRHRERCRADPVDVVVAVDADPLARRDRCSDPVACGRGVAEQLRVVTRAAPRREMLAPPRGRRTRAGRGRWR